MVEIQMPAFILQQKKQCNPCLSCEIHEVTNGAYFTGVIRLPRLPSEIRETKSKAHFTGVAPADGTGVGPEDRTGVPKRLKIKAPTFPLHIIR